MEKSLEQLFYFALGSALAVKEKVEKNSEEFRAAADNAEKNAREFFDQMAKKGEEEKGQFREMLKGVMKEVIDDLGLATREDLDQLRKDLGK